MTESIPHLNIEILDSGIIRLENESIGDSYVVDLHPIHLRYIAEKMGLMRELSASEGNALRRVDKLARRLRVLHGHIEQLQKWMGAAPDMDNADINTEYSFNDATLDLANEFLREIDESGAVVTPPHAASRDGTQSNPAETPPAAGKKQVETQRVLGRPELAA